MNKIAGLRNPWNSCGPEVPQKPENDEDDNEKFEHERFLSAGSARVTVHRATSTLGASFQSTLVKRPASIVGARYVFFASSTAASSTA